MSDVDFLWRVGHDPLSVDLQRCDNYQNTRKVLARIQESSSIQIFPKNQSELASTINRLPGDWNNIYINPYHGDREILLTRERVFEVLEMWDLTDATRSETLGRLRHGPRECLSKRFALHLSQWLAMEEFLALNKKYFLLIDDDIQLQDNFIDSALAVVEHLPNEWDVFNFAVPTQFKENFKSHLQISSEISIPYFFYNPTALIFSRTGVKKYLFDCLFDVFDLEIGNANIDKNIDMRLNNMELVEPFDDCLYHYSVDYSQSRKFQSYTFTPNAISPIDLLQSKSLWQ